MMIAEEGTRVIRGEDWAFGDHDGGEGHVGTIVDINWDMVCKRALVVWDNGTQGYYEVERPGKSEIIAIELNTNDRNDGFCCVNCYANERGTRWCCSLCPDVILCTKCYMADAHDVIHKFKRIAVGSYEWIVLPARKTSRKIMLRGLFEGAIVTLNHEIPDDSKEKMKGNVIRYLDNRNFKFCAVKIMWNDPSIKDIFYLGQAKKVDVKCTISGKGPFYYVDHLPPFYNANLLKKRAASTQAISVNSFHSKYNQRRFLSLQGQALPSKDETMMSMPNKKSHSFEKLKQIMKEQNDKSQNYHRADFYCDDKSKVRKQLDKEGVKETSSEIGIIENDKSKLFDNFTWKTPSASVQTTKTTHGNGNEKVNEKSRSKCCLCKENDCNVEMKPCGHCIACINCIRYFKKCYQCKENIIFHYEIDKENSLGKPSSNKGEVIC